MFSKKIIGIDIGAKYIKIALVKKSKRKHEVIRTLTVYTPSDGVVDGEIRDVDTVTARIRSALRDLKFKASELYFTINAASVVTREVKLPALKDSEIDPAVEFELSQSFPGIIQSHTISTRIYSEPGMPVEGTAVFCPNKVLNDFVEVARGLLIPLKGIDFNANALAKVVHHYLPPERKHETFLIVDIGYTMSQVSLISDGKLILSRNISSGIARYDNLIVNRVGVTPDQAVRARQNNKYDIFDLGREDIDNFINVAFSSVAGQIRSILDYYRYNTTSDESKISGIFLFTNRGLDSLLAEYLSQAAELPVEFVELKKTKRKRSESSELNSSVAAAIGATMTPTVGQRDINLLPKLKEIREATLRRIKLTRVAALIAAVALLSLAIYGFLVLRQYGVTADTMSVQEEIIKYSSINETKNRLRQATALLASAESVLEKYNSDDIPGTWIFDLVSTAMPESVFAVSYSQTEDGKVNISGVSKNLTDLPDFVYNLKQSGKVEKAVLSNIVSREAEDGSIIDYNFTIEIIPKKAGAENEG